MTNAWNLDKPYDYGSSWVGCRPYIEEINNRISGKRDVSWFDHTLSNYVFGTDTPASILLLGSNEGHMELTLCRRGFAGQIVASDVADKALERARAKVAAEGHTNIRHLRYDLNKDTIDGIFDLIIAEGVLHHIEKTQFCFDNLQAALRPGGHLVAMEYVGAYRFQLPDIQRHWINAALACEPRLYRPVQRDGDPSAPISWDQMKHIHYVTPSADAVAKVDPSEAVSGYLLPDLMRRYFEVIEERTAGGSIGLYIEGHFPFNLANSDAKCAAWIKHIASLEHILCDQGILPSDLVFYVAKRKV